MNFFDKIQELSARIPELSEYIKNEEATKQTLIIPFTQALGYDTSDPRELESEYDVDIDGKGSTKVDFAILRDGKPIILIECKRLDTLLLSEGHVTQLRWYFNNTKEARFGVLTNGIEYHFYSDLNTANQMDEEPFLIFDLSKPDEQAIFKLEKFSKDFFDEKELISSARNWKIERLIADELNNPSEAFARFFAEKVFSEAPTESDAMNLQGVIKETLKTYTTKQIESGGEPVWPHMSVEEFVRMVLEEIPDKCNPDITLDIFKIIKNSPAYHQQYESYNKSGRASQRIPQAIKNILKRDSVEICDAPPEFHDFLKTYTRFESC